MRLIVDASTLVAEVLRARGRELLARHELELFVATEAWSEAEHELRKRVTLLIDHGRISEVLGTQLLGDALDVILARITLVPPDVYAEHVSEAQQRIPRDADDVPTVALALTLGCGIWTADRDFFGCGLPVWTTETLLRYIERQREAAE